MDLPRWLITSSSPKLKLEKLCFATTISFFYTWRTVFAKLSSSFFFPIHHHFFLNSSSVRWTQSSLTPSLLGGDYNTKGIFILKPLVKQLNQIQSWHKNFESGMSMDSASETKSIRVFCEVPFTKLFNSMVFRHSQSRWFGVEWHHYVCKNNLRLVLQDLES